MAKTHPQQRLTAPSAVIIEMSAVLTAVNDEAPKVLLLKNEAKLRDRSSGIGLPCGPFDPQGHRTLEEGLRRWVEEQTELPLGYVEQLYTFGDRFRDPQEREGGPRPISVGYLALVRQTDVKNARESDWSDWYRHFPWEDWRSGPPALIAGAIKPALQSWIESAPGRADRQRRQDRFETTFGQGGAAWDNERVLERYELLYEAGLVQEAAIDGHAKPSAKVDAVMAAMGTPLVSDHRRILATAMGRLRGKIKYRPVIFELMPPSFTLFQLQRAVEALAGARLHKQNFRRLVAHEGLVEPTGHVSAQTGGRPAELFRFRREVLRERRAPGVRLPARVARSK
ncbi:MAG: hypothetical protein SFV19_20060 [Rhodospirillaceae bacterium]|nr:hypothetical protein [Rhodospirillaceae bacterium]